MKKKRGQFFILAAVIAVILIFSFAGLIFFKKPPKPKIYEIGKNFKFEVAEIIAQGKMKEISGEEVDMINYLDNITHEYLKYSLTKDPNMEIIYVYGNSSNVVVYNFANRDLCVYANSYCEKVVGGRKNLSNILALGEIKQKVIIYPSEYKGALEYIRKLFSPSNNQVIINIYDRNYTFELSENEQFYLILKTTKRNETIVTIQ